MRHRSDRALSASSGGVCDSAASRTMVQRVEVNRPSRVVSVGDAAGMRRFYSGGGNKQVKQHPGDALVSLADEATASPVPVGRILTNSDHAKLHPPRFADHVLVPRR